MTKMKNEIILYRPDELAEHIEVRLVDETFWLSQQQIADLFGTQRPAIKMCIRDSLNAPSLDQPYF